MILITGCAGFIGTNLSIALLKLGENVIGLDNFDPFYDRTIKEQNLNDIRATAKPSPGGGYFRFYEGDLCNRELLRSIFQDGKIDKVIHLAALAGVRPSLQQPARYMHTNVYGTTLLLEECRAAGVDNIIAASSSSVYGDRTTKDPFREDDIQRDMILPHSPYATSKLAMEMVCQNLCHAYGLNIICLRFFTVYGPRQRPEMAIHKFMNLILKDSPIEIYGDGLSSRDYTYIDDIVDGIINAHFSTLPGFHVYNLGNSRPVPLVHLAHKLYSLLDRTPFIVRKPRQQGDVMHTCANIHNAYLYLHYNPKVDLDTGLQRFIEWKYRRQS